MGEHGTSTITPWPEVTPESAMATIPDWRVAWPDLDYQRIDPVQSAADFYLLFGMASGAFVELKPLRLPPMDKVLNAARTLRLSVADIANRNADIARMMEENPAAKMTAYADKADTLLRQMVETLDPVFRAYVHLACGGELRHHQAIGHGKTLSSNRRDAWAIWRVIFDRYGPDSLVEMARLFREFESDSYGNEKWAVAAEVLHGRETGNLGPDTYLNKQMFVDRVFTLEHNGGCFLNKLDWRNNRAERGYDFCGMWENMPSVLDAHASDPPNIYMLHGHASESIQDFLYEYINLAQSIGLDIYERNLDQIDWREPPEEVVEEKLTVHTGGDGENHVVNEIHQGATTTKMVPKVTPEPTELPKDLSGWWLLADDEMKCPPYNGWSTITFVLKFYDEKGDVCVHETEYHLKHSELMSKTFYWKHMLKQQYPGIPSDHLLQMEVNISKYGDKWLSGHGSQVPNKIPGKDLAYSVFLVN